MAEDRARRRLAAILVADVVGYSRLIEFDEAGTLSALKHLRREVIDPLLSKYSRPYRQAHGRRRHRRVRLRRRRRSLCGRAAEGHRGRRADGMSRPERRIVFRIGVNLGDVVVEGDDLLGDGVNVAARLEQLCDPGGVLVSGTAYDQLHGKLDVPLEFCRRAAGQEHRRAGSHLSCADFLCLDDSVDQKLNQCTLYQMNGGNDATRKEYSLDKGDPLYDHLATYAVGLIALVSLHHEPIRKQISALPEILIDGTVENRPHDMGPACGELTERNFWPVAGTLRLDGAFLARRRTAVPLHPMASTVRLWSGPRRAPEPPGVVLFSTLTELSRRKEAQPQA